MKFGVIRFPGSCDDVDAQLAASRVGEAVLLWHADRDLQGVDAVIVPGGFSYGDYLRAGKIFFLDVRGDDPAAVEAEARRMAEELLANPVIEGYDVLLETDRER